jgi:hypothetical protein
MSIMDGIYWPVYVIEIQGQLVGPVALPSRDATIQSRSTDGTCSYM